MRKTLVFLRFLWGGCLALAAGFVVSARDLPVGMTVRHGEVMQRVDGRRMVLEQASARAIVNWESFDIGAGHAVEVRQPSSGAAMLARVTGGSPSEIWGRLSANGGFYLVNPAGILFGSGAVVDVNRLLATTRQLSDRDFLAGRLRLVGESAASVENCGSLSAESVALVAQEVVNRGVIQGAQSALVGAGQVVTLQNFANGARLAVDFSGLGGDLTRVENCGTVDASGGEAVLTAAGGAGQVWAQDGRVAAATAEFSGRNSALSRLGAVSAEELVIDPTANLVIGAAPAVEAELGYGLAAEEAGAEELELSVTEPQPEFTEGVGYGFHDENGNGWTYMHREANTLGGQLESYSYLDPVLTYYNSDYLSAQLEQQGVTLNYARRGTTDGSIAVGDGVRLGGSQPLTLQAEANLTVGAGVLSENASALTLQAGRDVTIGDLTTAGAVAIVAGNQLSSGRLDAEGLSIEIKNSLVLSDGVQVRSGDLSLSGESVHLGGEVTVAGAVQIAAEQVVATSAQQIVAGQGVTVDGAWQLEHQPLTVVAEHGDVRLRGAVRDAEAVAVTAEGDIEVSGVQSNGDILLTSSGASVRVAGDLASSGGVVEGRAAGALSVDGEVSAQEAFFESGGDLTVAAAPASAVEALTLENSGAGTAVGLNWPSPLPSLVIATTGGGSAVMAEVGDVAGGRLSATGSGSSLELSGQKVCLQEVSTVDGDVVLAASELTVGDVQSERGGAVSLRSEGDLVVQGVVSSADDLSLTAGGSIVLESQERLASGGALALAAASFDDGRTPLVVDAGGKLYISAVPGVADTSVFALVSGRSRDGAIHTRGRRLPGLVIYNGRVWLGRPEQMSKVDRAETSLFSRVCRILRTEY